MITEEDYRQYIADFNGACAGTGMSYAEFYDKWYEPDATFEYIPKAATNSGKDSTVAFFFFFQQIMEETIRDHTRFIASGTQIAIESPIDFVCKKDLEWVGVHHKAGVSFRLMVAGFYDVSENDKIKYTRVYSIYNAHYQPT